MADLILKHIAQLVTCASGGQPKRGKQMRDLSIIEDGMVVIEGEQIAAVGTTEALSAEYAAHHTLDLRGKTVIPGLVDCHTHLPYAGNRYDEFELRIAGRSYMDILAAGGGIHSTVRATRAASLDHLLTQSLARLTAMMHLGTTTIEGKTGYGLSAEHECKQLHALLAAHQRHVTTVVPTYLGAHATPAEYSSAERYLDHVLSESLPQAQALYAASACNMPFFVDMFVETGVFSVKDMVRYFNYAQAHNLPFKAHVDQFESLGAVPIAVEMGAVSLDHLEVTSEADLAIIAHSDTVGVMLPAVNFNLGISRYGNARYLIDHDGILALSTDYNPGSSPTMNLPLVMALACRYQKLVPAEALNGCTINAAYALRLAERVGSIEVGKQADLVVLNTDDYRSMIVEFGRNFVEQVYIKGQLVWTTSS
ncbi:MAG: imidazolonepropionase [Anaerolineae bacterium]